MSTESSSVVACPRRREQLEVVVVGDDQRPLADVVLELGQPRDSRVVRGRTDAQGLCLFRGLAPGEYRVRLPLLEPSLWRVLGALPLKKAADDAPPAPWAEPPPPPEKIEWTCQGVETAALVAARLGLRPAQLVEAEKGTAPAADLALPKGTRLQAEVPAPRWMAVKTGHRHAIHRAGLPLTLALQLLDEEHLPRRGCDYLLKITLDDGSALPHRTGATDEEGRVVETLPARAATGELLLDAGKGAPQKTKLRFAALAPLTEDAGVQQRLEKLGFPCGGETGAPGPATRAALKWFQYSCGLPATGEIDDPTRVLLFAGHRS